MAAEGIDIVAVHEEIMTSLPPSEEEIVHIATETLLAGNRVDFEEAHKRTIGGRT